MDDERRERLRSGGIAGAVAFVVGLVLASVLESGLTASDYELFRAETVQGTDTGLAGGSGETMTYGDLAEVSSQLPAGSNFGQPSSFQIAGWLYHKAHFASVEGAMQLDLSGQSVEATLAFVGEPSTLLYLLPVVLVGAAGYWVGDQFDADDAREAARDGAHVAAGYGGAALVSVFLLEWSASAEISQAFVQGTIAMSAGPTLVTAVLFTGILYPAVVGAAGGYVGHEFVGE